MKKAREKAGLTTRQLAEALGIAQPTLTNIEVGKRPCPERLLEPMAEALGVDADELALSLGQLRPWMIEVAQDNHRQILRAFRRYA